MNINTEVIKERINNMFIEISSYEITTIKKLNDYINENGNESEIEIFNDCFTSLNK